MTDPITDPIPIHRQPEFADAQMSACGEPLFMPAVMLEPGTYPARLCPACWPAAAGAKLTLTVADLPRPLPQWPITVPGEDMPPGGPTGPARLVWIVNKSAPTVAELNAGTELAKDWITPDDGQ